MRFCAVRWATSIFDLWHCPSRFICMLGAADSKLDIRSLQLVSSTSFPFSSFEEELSLYFFNPINFKLCHPLY